MHALSVVVRGAECSSCEEDVSVLFLVRRWRVSRLEVEEVEEVAGWSLLAVPLTCGI
jgi:hypothetical protein